MIYKLPLWVEVGGFCMACIAGSMNAIGVLSFENHAISHLTGISTLLGVSLSGLHWVDSIHLLGIIFAFVFGAVLAGAIVGSVALQLGRHYSFALILESLLILGALAALTHDSAMGPYLMSVACGLQNGMVSAYSGTVVRTTHVTGLFTDLGTMMGAALRGHPVNSRRVILYLLLIVGFILGGIIASVLFAYVHHYALLFPAWSAATLAAIYWIFSHRTRQRKEDRRAI